ncbi:MAG: Fic family protein [Fimbriimonas sp.]
MKIPGEYKRSYGGWKTFLPHKLPMVLDVSKSNHTAAEEVTHLLGQVEMCRTLLPNSDLLIYSSLQKEALASSTIEGTIASAEELVRFQASHKTDREPVREVGNYSQALSEGRSFLRNSPLTLKMILNLHDTLMQGVRGDDTAGKFKTSQNFIGGYGDDAAFIPAAPEDVPDLMNNLECYINEPQDHARIIKVALTHYQFETIHPFGDGNGRVGRLLILLQLIHHGLLSDPLIYPSVYFERRRTQYYDALQGVREKGAWNAYLSYFLDGISTQCRETISFTRTCIELESQMREQIKSVTRQASVHRVLEEFFKVPVLKVAQIAVATGMSHNTVQSAVDALIRSGTVVEITGMLKGRIYLCRPIYSLIFDPAPSNR